MITLFILTEVEIYVLAAVGAAAVIAFCAKPSAKGAARQHLLAGTLCYAMCDEASDTVLDIECLDNGNVLLTRRGLRDLTDSDAVSLAVTIIGFDITIQERIIAGKPGDDINTALFTLDFLGFERYHLHYISEPTALSAAFTLSNRPGMRLSRKLTVLS